MWVLRPVICIRVQMRVLRQIILTLIWKHVEEFILEKSHSNVSSATNHSKVKILWKHTTPENIKFMLVINFINVNFLINKSFKINIICKFMEEFILTGINLSIVNSVTSHSHRNVIHTKMHTGEKPFSCKFCDLSFIQSNPKKHSRKVYQTERDWFLFS